MADSQEGVIYTPETPGKDVVFIKPNIPNCWGVQPTLNKINNNEEMV